ncbi:MAG: hypothetical protein D8H97_03935 [Neisseria sp.]|nr:MAG: hypothetical protein D8H97_03935 [Neisseria sp.]
MKRYFPNVPSAGYLDIQNQTLIELNFKSDADVAFESLPLAAKIDTSKVTRKKLRCRNFCAFLFGLQSETDDKIVFKSVRNAPDRWKMYKTQLRLSECKQA